MLEKFGKFSIVPVCSQILVRCESGFPRILLDSMKFGLTTISQAPSMGKMLRLGPMLRPD